MGIFNTNLMNLTDEYGNIIQPNLACQIDTVNQPYQVSVEGMVTFDLFDLYSLGWTCPPVPVPVRGSNYFVDQATGEKYAVYGRPEVYSSHIQVRVSLPSGSDT